MVDATPQLGQLLLSEQAYPFGLRLPAGRVVVVDRPRLGAPPLKAAPELLDLIDQMGMRSAVAQGLRGHQGRPAPVTSRTQLGDRAAPQRLYLFVALVEQKPSIVGLLKLGEKQLFHWDARGVQRQLAAQTCVLDFYVHEDWQRCGVGRDLFAAML